MSELSAIDKFIIQEDANNEDLREIIIDYINFESSDNYFFEMTKNYLEKLANHKDIEVEWKVDDINNYLRETLYLRFSRHTSGCEISHNIEVISYRTPSLLKKEQNSEIIAVIKINMSAVNFRNFIESTKLHPEYHPQIIKLFNFAVLNYEYRGFMIYTFRISPHRKDIEKNDPTYFNSFYMYINPTILDTFFDRPSIHKDFDRTEYLIKGGELLENNE